MNKNKINILVGEELGWVYVGSDSYTDWYLSPKNAPLMRVDPVPYDVVNHRRQQIPKFIDSLDLCHQIIKSLTDEELHIFNKHLIEIPHVSYSWAAQPIDFCIAFLKTRNKYED